MGAFYAYLGGLIERVQVFGEEHHDVSVEDQRQTDSGPGQALRHVRERAQATLIEMVTIRPR